MTDAVNPKRPQAPIVNYPAIVESSPASQRRAESAWRLWLSEYNAPQVSGDLDPVLGVPRSLPAALAQKITINLKGELLSPEEAKELLRQFIFRSLRLLSGAQPGLALKDLSLVSFSAEGVLYRATYKQVSFPFPLANGYGTLQITIARGGQLLQMSSRLVPPVEIPTMAVIDASKLPSTFVGREFNYSAIDGRPLKFRVAASEEAIVRELVIFPKENGDRILFHLAYPVEVGRGLSWTVFVDAISGKEIEVKQNFNT